MLPEVVRRLTAAILLAAALCMAGAQAAPAAGVLHRSTSAEPPSLDPSRGSGTIAAPLLADLVEGLLARTPEQNPAPASAERWEVSEDGLLWTFHLRDDLRWSDGRPLTAEDFAWSFRRLLDPDTAAPSAGLFFMIENARGISRGELPPSALGVDAPDGRTLTIRLDWPAPYLPQLLANTQAVPVPRHVIEAEGRDWARPGTMVSNGAFTLEDRVPQTVTTLARNPHYYAAEEVSLDEVRWYPTPDMGAAFRRFRAGELDVVLNLAPDDALRARREMPEALRGGPMFATYTLVFNTRQAPFDDRRVRRALALAVDRDAITDRLLRTGARPAWGWVSPGIGGYPGLVPAEADRSPKKRLEEARALLAEAGYDDERPLVVPLLYDTQEENRRIMVAVASMWQSLGPVRVELDNQEFRAVVGRLRSGNFSVARSSTFALYEDPFAYLQQAHAGATANTSGYSNPEYDALLEAANRESDSQARLQLLMQAEEMLLADQPLIPVYYYHGKLLVSPRVKGWWDARIGTPPSRWLSVEQGPEGRP